jgi:hypothetical protein
MVPGTYADRVETGCDGFVGVGAHALLPNPSQEVADDDIEQVITLTLEQTPAEDTHWSAVRPG